MKKFILITLMGLFTLSVSAQNNQNNQKSDPPKEKKEIKRTEIKPADVDKKIVDYVKVNFADFTIEKAVKIEKNEVTKYRIQIKKENTIKVLFFDKDFKFLNEEQN